MADVNAGALVYQFKADVSGLTKGLADASAKLKELGSTANDNAKKLSDGLKGVDGAATKLSHSLHGATDAASLNRMQMMELTHVARSAFDALASGASPFRVLAQESGRLSQAIGSGQGGIAGGLKALGNSVGSVFTPMRVGMLALAATGVAFVSIIEKWGTEFRTMQQAAKAATVSIGDLIMAQRIADKTLGGFDASSAMLSFAKNLREAQQTSNDLSKMLAKNGVSLVDMAGKARPVKDVFDQIAQKVVNTKNELDKIHIAETLGLGSDAVPFLEKYVEELKAGRTELTAAGRESLKLKENAAEIQKAWSSMWDEIKRASVSAAFDILGAFGNMLHQLAANFEENVNRIRGSLAELTGDMKAASEFASKAEQARSNENARQAATDVRDNGFHSAFGNLDGARNALGDSKPRSVTINKAKRPDTSGFNGVWDSPDRDKKGPKDKAESFIETLKKQSAELKIQVDLYGKSATEQAVALNLIKAGEKATADQKAQITAITTETEKWKEKLQALKDQTQSINDAARGMADLFGNALDQIGQKGANAKTIMQDLLKSIMSVIEKSLLMGSGPLAGIMGTAGKDGAPGGILGGLFSSMFGGFKAAGGPVMGGKAYVVGENGPEMFFPQGGGSIAPNGAQWGGSGSSQTPNIIFHDFAGVALESRVTRNEVHMIARDRADESVRRNNKNLLPLVSEQQARRA